MNRGKNYKGISLLEVIIVLAIITLTMVSATAVVFRANSAVKDNEIQDTANELLLQAFELLRSPEPVKVLQGGFTELSTAGTTTVYTMKFDSNLSRNGYLRKATNQAIIECSLTSEYNVDAIGASRPYPICLRVSITPVSGGTGISYYNITINLSYFITGRTISEDYSVSRNEKFVQVN